MALAQSPDTTSSPAQTPDSEKRSQFKTYNDEEGRRTASGKKTTMVGYIFGQDGKYILMTKKSANVELISTEDLKAHVGHKVKVMGVLDNVSSMGDATRGSSSDARPDSMADDGNKPESSMGSHNQASSQLRVSKMKMISESCDMKSDKSSDKSWTHILNL